MAAADLFRAVTDRAPDSRLVVIGPIWSDATAPP